MSEAPERIFFDQRDKRPRIITVPHMAEPPVSPFVREYVPADLLAAKDAEIAFLTAQLEAFQDMAPPPKPGLLRKRLAERRAAITDPAAPLPDQK